MSEIDSAWAEYLDGFTPVLDTLRAQFTYEDYLELPNFGPPVLRQAIADDVARLLDEHGQRKKLTIGATGNTPRHLEVVGRDPIDQHSAVVPGTYHSVALRRFLAHLTKEDEIIAAPYTPEEFVASRMSQTGDVHGWHWDDYPYALVWIVEAPAPGAGGELEFVRGTQWDKNAPRVQEYLRTRQVQRRAPATGSAYLLRADTSMHRVAPLTREGSRRIILCFSYAVPADRDRDLTHETVDFYS
ncbi:HalD/BesD family halogenase [Micromonospora echinospora]